MRHLRKAMATSLLGFVVSVSGCATTTSSCDAIPGEEFSASETRIAEYELMLFSDLGRLKRGEVAVTNAVRAWIRHADKIIRANNAQRGDD